MQNLNNKSNRTIIPLEIVEKLRAEKLVKTQLDKSDNPTVKDQIRYLLSKMKFDENVPLYVSTISGELVYVNGGYQALVNDSESISGMVYDAKGDYKLPSSLVAILNEVQLTRTSVTVEESINIRGNAAQYRSRHFPICDDDGYVIAVGGTYTQSTDVTAEETGKSSSLLDQRYRDFARATSDWYWEVDRKMKLTYVSNRFTAITGTPAFTLTGKKIDEIGTLLDAYGGQEITSSQFM
ncbi:MAG: PAS domain-containing protein [Proteobacteria bacterium]|nr:PAS domain-containing protein [Pseudomonadota bacterium]